MKKRKKIPAGFINYALVTTIFAVCQILASSGGMSRSVKGLLVPICAYIVMSVSLNLTVGFSGELSLGHAGFMSLGAFSGIIAASWLSGGMNVESEAVLMLCAIVAGGIVAGIMGFLIGIPVLRLRGDYLAIVTLAFCQIILNLLNCLYVSLDGSSLLFSFNKPNLPGTMLFKGPTGATGVSRISTFTAGFLLIIFTLIVVQNLVNSRTGRAIMATRDNRIAAESMGINVTKYKMISFVTSAALAGMGGALYGLNYSQLAPKKFDYNTSILILVYVVLGGIGNIRGCILSTILLVALPEVLRAFSDYRMLVYAVVLILVMIFTNNPVTRAITDRIFAPVRRLFSGKKAGGDAR